MSGVAEIYQRTRKRPDLPFNTYLARPVAAVVVRAVSDTTITPNQITLSAVLVALVSAGLMIAAPGYWGLLAAVAIFEASYVLDCADGMLARLRGIQSTPGHLLDFLMDELKAFVILAAAAVRLYLDQGEVRYLLLGIAGLVVLASGIALTTFQRRPEIAPPAPSSPAPGGGEPRPTGLSRVLGFGVSALKLVVHYPSYLWLVALVGCLELYFYPYIAVNALYAGVAFLKVGWRFGRA